MLYSPLATGILFVLASAGCQSGWNTQGSELSTPPAQLATQQGSGSKTEDHPALLDPTKATEQAPDTFKVIFTTTKGDFVVECHREWSPVGADRFYNLCKIGYFTDVSIFRAVKGFMFQFGIHGDPAVSDQWSEANIKDDAPSSDASNTKGYLSFAKTKRPHTRSTQMFVNLTDNSFLDKDGFTPFGKVIEGMDVIDKINTEYGENVGNVQGDLKSKGNEYIREKFPNIDFVKSVKIIRE